METCIRCKRELPESAFSPSVLKHRMVIRCKECFQEIKKRKKPMDDRPCVRCGTIIHRAKNQKYCTLDCRKRGLTLAQYGLAADADIEMYEDQRGMCGACDEPLGSNWSVMHIDHCHDTGRVRGLLHAHCNKTLVDDLEQQFRRAVYLARAELDLREMCIG